jgi:hypothetical protein
MIMRWMASSWAWLKHRRVTQSAHRHDLHDFDALLVQPNDLLAPLVQLLSSV